MRIVELSGGVGGARMARGLAGLSDIELTVIVNVGDDADNLGLHISPDLDTVVYTLAGVEGEFGWGRSKDTFVANEELARFGVDNRFRLGDKDLALKLHRTQRIRTGMALSRVTEEICASFDISARVLPATDDRLRTEVRIDDATWLDFQTYFVKRRAQDEVLELRFIGADSAVPAPGVVESIDNADMVVIAPSNPPLSIWPILAVPGVRDAVERHGRVTAISPLIGGKPVKGPVDRVMASLRLQGGNRGILEAYRGLIDTFVIDRSDRGEELGDEVEVVASNTLIKEKDEAIRLAEEVITL